MTPKHPALQGGLLALSAALLFGLSTPLIAIVGTSAGPFTTAALLYASAALVGALLRRQPQQEAALRRADLPRVAAMALLGAVLGPAALAWGLQQTSTVAASLLLTLEALFTAVLARWLYAEAMDRRVWTAMALLTAGAVVLVVDRGASGTAATWGLLAVLAATSAWALDNSLSRAVAERDPAQVVLVKSLLGSALSAALAFVLSEQLPPLRYALALALVGAAGYGLSVRLYLLAQRAFGAARTGSVFGLAPFVGALGAITLGERNLTWSLALAALLMLSGVLLHLIEAHDHEHVHEALAHEHAHSHDDGHHDHAHDPMPIGAHSHWHEHRPLKHSHPHVPDAHHQHRH